MPTIVFVRASKRQETSGVRARGEHSCTNANLRIDGNRHRIAITRANREISDIQLHRTIVQTQRNVRNAYWGLVFTQSFLAVQRQSLELAEESLRNNRTRVEVGTMALWGDGRASGGALMFPILANIGRPTTGRYHKYCFQAERNQRGPGHETRRW